jgi:hypothetical protein
MGGIETLWLLYTLEAVLLVYIMMWTIISFQHM